MLRAAWLTLSAATGRARGFVIPYRYAAGVTPPASYPALVPLFAAAEPEFRALLAQVRGYLDRLLTFGGEEPPAPRFDQDWFPRLDAAIAYTMTRMLRPARVVEIGSGHSTRFFARAVADAGSTTKIVTIDPAPRATITGLPVEFVRSTLQLAGLDPFRGLAPGDMVSVDSSHILMPGTDVDIVLNTVLLAVPAGVLIHFHDIFLPDSYPADWSWRGYNEQNAVAALATSGGYRLRWASRYVTTRLANEVAAAGLDRLPLVPGARESSLWLEKVR